MLREARPAGAPGGHSEQPGPTHTTALNSAMFSVSVHLSYLDEYFEVWQRSSVTKKEKRKKRTTNSNCWFLYAIFLKQNHSMVGVGRDLCGSSSPTLLLKQGHLQQVAQELVQTGLEYLQRRRLHNLPGQPVPGLRHPQREEVLPCVQLELPLLQFVPVALCPVAGGHTAGAESKSPVLELSRTNLRKRFNSFVRW